MIDNSTKGSGPILTNQFLKSANKPRNDASPMLNDFLRGEMSNKKTVKTKGKMPDLDESVITVSRAA